MPPDIAEVVEGELLPDVIEKSAPITLFGTSDPRVALERMADVAAALVDVIDTQKLYVLISGKKYVRVEGWTTLGGMLGIVPIVTGTRPNDTGDGIVAMVEARTLDGRVVGAAEGECSRAESKWRRSDSYAIRSMAQTRAISRALRAPLGQIFVLAGYEATPAEEMPTDDARRDENGVRDSEQRARTRGPIPDEIKPTDEQREEIVTLLRTLERIKPDVDWGSRCRELAGVPWDMATRTVVQGLIERLQGELRRRTDEDEAA
jgi:hypothetical protein